MIVNAVFADNTITATAELISEITVQSELTENIITVDAELADNLVPLSAALDDNILAVECDLINNLVVGEKYTGSYDITPSTAFDIVLMTDGKEMTDNVTVRQIPIEYEQNDAGGLTVTIGG